MDLSDQSKTYLGVAIIIIIIKISMNMMPILKIITHYGPKLLNILLFGILIELFSKFNNTIGWIISGIFIISNVIMIF